MSERGENASASIRPARMRDAGGIAQVHVQGWRSSYRGIVPDDYLASMSERRSEATWRKTVSDSDRLTFVAEVSGQVLGFSCGGKNRGDEAEFDGELYAIYVRQGHQRHGLGRRLAVAVAEGLYALGWRSMLVWVLRENPACRFNEPSAASSWGRNL